MDVDASSHLRARRLSCGCPPALIYVPASSQLPAGTRSRCRQRNKWMQDVGQFSSPWLHYIFGWMKCHHWLSVSYKLISAIDGDAITNYGMISLLSPADSQFLCPDSYCLAISRWYEAENHVQAYAPWGALSLDQQDSLTSKLDGYPAGWDSPLSGSKPVHEENCQGIKLRIAYKIKRLNSSL